MALRQNPEEGSVYLTHHSILYVHVCTLIHTKLSLEALQRANGVILAAEVPRLHSGFL